MLEMLGDRECFDVKENHMNNGEDVRRKQQLRRDV